MRSLNTALAAVVRTPAVSIKSFNASGMPCSGPRHSPRVISVSALRASAIAESAVIVMNAFSTGFNFSIRVRHSRVSSTGETLPLRSSTLASRMDCNQFSFGGRHYIRREVSRRTIIIASLGGG